MLNDLLDAIGAVNNSGETVTLILVTSEFLEELFKEIPLVECDSLGSHGSICGVEFKETKLLPPDVVASLFNNKGNLLSNITKEIE